MMASRPQATVNSVFSAEVSAVSRRAAGLATGLGFTVSEAGHAYGSGGASRAAVPSGNGGSMPLDWLRPRPGVGLKAHASGYVTDTVAWRKVRSAGRMISIGSSASLRSAFGSQKMRFPGRRTAKLSGHLSRISGRAFGRIQQRDASSYSISSKNGFLGTGNTTITIHDFLQS
jgi:hypothetical protein